jgi:NadR type nicotinamide-nucleotide adenylyltransferase
MKRGLTLGKYAPFHRGHQLVIETALAEMDEVQVVIYDAPETHIPLSVRAAWIRSLYPQVEVIEARNGPTAVGYSAEIKRIHERYLIDTLKIEGITHFYSSEPYGEHMSAALGAVDRRVDEQRKTVPISATQIRENPYALRSFVDPVVYRNLVVNVVLLGAPCSGKTTLAQQLAVEFGTQWMPEYGREYWEAHQVERRLTPEQLLEIAQGHLVREDQKLLQANRYLFTDTNALTTAHFAKDYHGSVQPELAQLADQAVSRYQLVLLCAIDFPYVDSWDRSGEVNRQHFQSEIIAELHKRKLDYFEITGSVTERVAQVKGILQNDVKSQDEG